ncbi:MAG TPA: trypsin-like serine protease [Thermoanaerobaculia bacterium]|nr:trypsin-like serine protease [Thermoanaerobaculia bacterium]
MPDSGEEKSIPEGPVPLNPSDYLPMPLPQRDGTPEEKAAPRETGLPVSFDLRNRKATVGEPPALKRRAPGIGNQVPGGLGEAEPDWDSGVSSKNFSGLSLVGSPSSYPWSAAVKLFMKFRDTGGTLRGYQCSGTLIDPRHVVTAGHCVYAHEDTDNGWSFYDWAEEIIVVPAYDNGSRPYGDAYAVELHSWTGWTDDEDFDDDYGLIDLERPVGALAGWLGYGWSSNCGFYTGNTFRHMGYPAEWPYSGQLMYTNSGSYDGCETFLGVWYGNEVSFNSLSYGGQSGSGSHQPSGSCPNCYVYAMLSNGNSSTTWDSLLNEPKSTYTSSAIADDTPASRDLIPLNVRISPGSIRAGSQLSSMDYLVHNNSSVSWSGTVNVNVYLSSNDIISTADTFLQSHSFTWSFTPKSSVRITVSTPPTIPAASAAGSYWIGIILDATDSNVSNNYSDGQDAAPVTISASSGSVVTTNPATSIGQTGATLNGSVNPSGLSTTVYFDYGTTTGYGSTVTHGNIGSGTSPVNVAKPVTSLSCGVLYHFRVRATNSSGTSNGTDRTFQTSACSTVRNPDTTGVFRPSNGALYLKNQNTSGFADVLLTYGLPGDYPVAGDWNGDGVDTIGIYRNGTFYLRNSNTNGFADVVVSFGASGDQPVVGDWNGDGIDTIGIFRNGTFYLRNSNTAGTADLTFSLGTTGDVGIAGDWNGDGVTTAGVFRPSNGALYLRNSNSTGFAEIVLTYGLPGDKPVTGDWNGDGVDTIGIYRSGTFYLRNSNTNGFADLVFSLGVNGDMPIAGDWNGVP